jgi:NADH-quinone oxidoreductase subunit H
MSVDEIQLIRMIIAVVATALFVAVSVIFLVYLERKVAGHVQRRPGPFEVGPHGMLQTIADAVKLLSKQPLKPDGADPYSFLAGAGDRLCADAAAAAPHPIRPRFSPDLR